MSNCLKLKTISKDYCQIIRSFDIINIDKTARTIILINLLYLPLRAVFGYRFIFSLFYLCSKQGEYKDEERTNIG